MANKEFQRKKSQHSTDHSEENDWLQYPILKTKTFKPVLRKEFVKRRSLLKHLDKSLFRPLTLISAPTGCGKSVTASQWLEEKSLKYLWLSVDEEHNDLSIFLHYILAMLKERWPQQSFGIERLIRGINHSANLIASTLINDIVNLQEHFVLVLDDYHSIEEEKIHDIIHRVLQYPPKNLHLMILTQRDPPLRLAKMRAKLQLNELRMRDLEFTVEEANELKSFIAPETSLDQVSLLVRRAEGWVTGVSVGLMGLARGVNFEKVVNALHSQSSVVAELLDEVIMNGLPRKDQKFLALTSLFDRFSEEFLIDMVVLLNDNEISVQHIADLIHTARERNLFLISLDLNSEWYRYHHLFRSQVMHRVGDQFNEELVHQIYKEASTWFYVRNFFEEALKYAILSKDMNFAVHQFDSVRLSFHNTEQFQRLERLIEMYPNHVINENVELLLSLAILQDHKADYMAMRTYLDSSEQILIKENYKEEDFNRLKGQFHCVSAYLPFMQGDFHSALHHAEMGLDLLPSSEPNYFREFALAYYALAQQAIGKMEKGLKRVLDTFDKPLIKNDYFLGRLFHIETLVLLIAGDAKRVRRPGMQLQMLHKPENYPGAWMAGIYAVTTSAYISDKLEDVHQFHEDLVVNRFSGRPFGAIHHFIIECLALAALEEWDRVDSCMEICKELASALDISPLTGMVRAFEVELALIQNDLDCAKEIAYTANFKPHPPLWYYYIPQLTEVKLLLASEQNEKAFQLLDNLIDGGKNCHNENLLIQALTLKSVLLHREGDHQLALESLLEALSLAKGKQHVQTFIAQGDTMIQLLTEIPEEQTGNYDGAEIERAFLRMKSRRHKRMDISLTSRETEILHLVNQGYKNHEIADKLFVSVDTIKKHLYNSYQKLYVNNRTNAINKVRELGLFDLQ